MTYRVLILTDDAGDAAVLENALAKARDGPFAVETMRTLAAGLERLRAGGIAAVLADLTLADSSGAVTFDTLFAAAPHTPILTLSAEEEEELALAMVQRGAQGYLSKGHFNGSLVPQALRSIIERKAVEETLFREQARAEIALNSISDAVLCTDTAGRVDYLNIAAEKITGWSREEAHGQPIDQVFRIIDGVSREPVRDTIAHVLTRNAATTLPANTVLLRRDGSEAAIEDSAAPIHDWDGQMTGAVIVFHDVSLAQAMTAKMAYLAQHDFLTNLPNRLLLNDRIAQAIILAGRKGTQLAVLFLDLDNFKHINDSLGHAAGDKLLQSVAQRLCSCVRGSDTVSRQGGDEFVILLAESRNGADAALTAEKIFAALAVPHAVGELELHMTTSIGISVFPADGTDAEDLIKSADTAMYCAKEKGRNNYQFFTSDMNVRAVERQHIETNLRRALEKQEFVLYYQPKVNLESGRITGAEALLRWIHPQWGLVLPTRFVPIAEDSGMIVAIGRWVLRQACLQGREWFDAGLQFGSIAVNISALEFRQPDFVAGVRTILEETGLDARFLQLEITESVLMRDAQASTAILHELKSMGMALAVDDFGTGYSSLSYLSQFPIDVLKIDQSLVSDIGSATDNGIIVSAVVGLGNRLKLRVVAEGVENQAQLAFLKKLRCEEAQGYFFSQPVSAGSFCAHVEIGIPHLPGRFQSDPRAALL